MLETLSTQCASLNKVLFFVQKPVLALFSSYQLCASYIYDIQFDVFYSFRRASYSRRDCGVSC